MNVVTAVIALAVAAVFIAIVVCEIRKKKRGECSCGGNCASCGRNCNGGK